MGLMRGSMTGPTVPEEKISRLWSYWLLRDNWGLKDSSLKCQHTVRPILKSGNTLQIDGYYHRKDVEHTQPTPSLGKLHAHGPEVRWSAKLLWSGCHCSKGLFCFDCGSQSFSSAVGPVCYQSVVMTVPLVSRSSTAVCLYINYFPK